MDARRRRQGEGLSLGVLAKYGVSRAAIQRVEKRQMQAG
jgi:predicted transcriptional regulator